MKKSKTHKWGVWSNSGTKDTEMNAVEWAKEAVERGAGEILVTSIERDGKCNGLDLELTSVLADVLKAPLIMSGGCGLAQDFVDGYRAGAAAVAAGTFFSQRDQNPMQCRSHIFNADLPIRMITS